MTDWKQEIVNKIKADRRKTFSIGYAIEEALDLAEEHFKKICLDKECSPFEDANSVIKKQDEEIFCLKADLKASTTEALKKGDEVISLQEKFRKKLEEFNEIIENEGYPDYAIRKFRQDFAEWLEPRGAKND